MLVTYLILDSSENKERGTDSGDVEGKEEQQKDKEKDNLTEEKKEGTTGSIYVGNLPYTAEEEKIEELFSKYGKVHRVTFVKDKDTGRTKGFGFVEMDLDVIDTTIEQLNDTEFGGRNLHVSKAKDRQERKNFRDRDGGGRDKYGGSYERRGQRNYGGSRNSRYNPYERSSRNEERGEEREERFNNYEDRKDRNYSRDENVDNRYEKQNYQRRGDRENYQNREERGSYQRRGDRENYQRRDNYQNQEERENVKEDRETY